jgi:hypothetical protein
MKTPILNITEEMSNIQVAQENSIAQKEDLEKRAENYANSILRFVRRQELCAEYCGGMYYA